MTFLILWNWGGGGGGAQLVPSGVSKVCTEETMAGDTPGQECSQDDVGLRLWMNIESPYGGGQSHLPGTTGSLPPVKFPAAPVLLADGPQLGSWRVAVVRGRRDPCGGHFWTGVSSVGADSATAE